MGIIRTTFALMVGAGVGAYVAQNYKIPNIKEKLNEYGVTKKFTEYGVPEKNIERIDGKSLTITDDVGVQINENSTVKALKQK